jgi:hypothetical protein
MARLTHIAAGSAVVVLAVLAAGCHRSWNSLTEVSRLDTGASGGRSLNLTGQVQDTLQRPVRDARIEILDGVQSLGVTTSDERGRFTFTSSAPPTNSITLQVTRDGFAPATVPVRGPDRTDITISLTAVHLVDLTGQYTITVSAAAECSQLPPALTTRTYVAEMKGDASNPLSFTSEIRGADFYPGYGSFFAVVGGDAARFFVSSADAYNAWLEDWPIFERLGPSSYLALQGVATVAVASGDVEISGTFNGSFAYCAAAREPAQWLFAPTCDAPVECKSSAHRLTLSRR